MITVQGKIVSVFVPDSPHGRFGLVVQFPWMAGGIEKTNLVTTWITKEQAIRYCKSGVANVTVTLSISEPAESESRESDE